MAVLAKAAEPKYPPLTLTPQEIAYLVQGTQHGLKNYPLLNAYIDPDNQPTAVAIILAESQGNVFALNDKPPDLSYGLAQINMYGPLGPTRRIAYGIKSNDELYKAELNVAMMAQLSTSGNNWKPWSTYTSGAYRKYLVTATNALKNPVNPTGKLATSDAQASESVFDRFLDWVNQGVLRGVAIIGGGALIIMAVSQAAKKGLK